MTDIVIVGAACTAIGKFGSSLAGWPAPGVALAAEGWALPIIDRTRRRTNGE